MEKIELCIFDVDGLLIDSERFVWPAAQKQAARNLGFEMDDEFIHNMIGKKYSECGEIFAKNFGTNIPLNVFIDELYRCYDEIVNNQPVPVLPGVVDVLDFLKENHIPTSIGTSTDEKHSRLSLISAGLMDYFDYAVFGDNVKKAKPDPEVYNRSIQHFNVRPENCLIFEDSVIGANAVYNAKANLVLVPCLVSPSKTEYEKAFKILKHIDEIIPTIKDINKL